MAEPFTLKAITETITSFWGRSALLLWCLACISLFLFVALAAGSHWKIGDTPNLFTAYGTSLGLAFPTLFVFAAFKTYSERPKPILSLLPKEQDSFWAQSKQPSGQIITQFALRFQATNFADGAVMLSDVALSRPFVRRRHIFVKHILVQHPRANTYSFRHPIEPHSLTYASADIMVDYPVGRAGRPMRIVLRVQDHAGRWYKLVFPLVRSMPLPQN
jgi:hypothetical protein